MVMSWGKYLVLLMAIVLIGWLVYAPSHNERDWKLLDVARDQGMVATLTRDQAAVLDSIVTTAIGLTQSGQTPKINQWGTRGILSVISYRSDVVHRWNFGIGNAVYDMALDAIFIDEALIDIYRLVPEGRTDTPSPMHCFVLFAVLHELGHRNSIPRFRLGSRRNLGFIAGSESDVLAETAADDYALLALDRASKNSVPNVTAIYRNSLDKSIGLRCSDLAGHDLTYCRLATALRTAAEIYLVGASPFPPFYSNDSHPPLTHRAIRLLQSPTLRNGLSPELSAHASVLREWFSRLQTASNRSARELFTDRLVEAVTPTSEGWLVISFGEYAVFPDHALSSAGFHRRLVPGEWKPIPNWNSDALGRYPHPFECADRIWCVADLKSGDVQVLNDPAYITRIRPPIDGSEFVFPSPPPGRWLYRIKDRDLQVFSEFSWQVSSLEKLQYQVPNELTSMGLSLEVANAGSNWIGFGLVQNGEEKKLGGWCWAPVSTRVGRLKCSKFKYGMWPLKGKSYLLSRKGADFRLYYATSNDSDTQVVILDSHGREITRTKIETHDFPIHRWLKLWQPYPAVWLGWMSVTEDGSLIASYIGDSVYRVRPSGEVSILMHPESLLTAGLNDEVVLVPHGASRSVYVTR